MSAPTLFPDDLTLRQAIALHRAALGDGLVVPEEPAVAAMFEAHDACHAIFDCGTDMPGEVAVDTLTLVATTMTLPRYLDYMRHPAVVGIFADMHPLVLLRDAIAALPRMLAAWRRGRQVGRPWDFDRYSDHLDRSLGEIRRSHGIQTGVRPSDITF